MITKWIEFSVVATGVEEFKIALSILEKASKGERGCVTYCAFQSADESIHFTVLESWATKEDFENHRVATHTSRFKTQCAGLIVSKKALSLKSIQKENTL